MTLPQARANVALLRSRQQGDATLEDVFRAGEFSRVIDLTQHTKDDAALLLRARAQARVASPADVLATLDGDFSTLSLVGRMEFHLTRAAALARRGDGDFAMDEMARAAAGASALQPLHVAEISLARAHITYILGDVVRADRCVNDVIAEASAISNRVAPQEGADVSDLLARAHLLRGTISGARYESDEQQASYRRALEYAMLPRPDPWLVADVAAMYARSLVDFPDPAAFEDFRVAILELPWTADTAGQRFIVLRSLAQSAALAGDRVEAFRYYREAIVCAPRPVDRLIGQYDRAMFMRQFSAARPELYEEELQLLAALADQIDWNSATDGQAVLLWLAQIFADVDLGRATTYLALYDRFSSGCDRGAFDYRSPLREGSHALAVGMIAKHPGGDRSVALQSLERALRLYVKVKCSWRATLAAIEILEIEEHAAAREIARRFCEHHERSWLAGHYRRRAMRTVSEPLDVNKYRWIS